MSTNERDLDVAWAAGLFEGEGCISINKRQQIRLDLAMTDQDVVKRFKAIVCAGAINVWTKPGFKPLFRWSIAARADVVDVLNLLQPFFGDRRYAKSQEALSIIVADYEKHFEGAR